MAAVSKRLFWRCINTSFRYQASTIDIPKHFSKNIQSTGLFIDEHGDPKVVLKKSVSEITNVLSENEVLVKMLMASINPSDINTIEGTYNILPNLPSFLGNEGVGEIVDVGNCVKDLNVGDWVLPSVPSWGTWRQYVVSPAENVQKIANDIPVLSAATLAVNPCTAYRILKDFVELKSGDYILQNGANSAVGQNVIQIAKKWGLKTINIIRDRPDDTVTPYLQQLGADHVVTEKFLSSKDMKLFMKNLNVDIKLALNCVGGKSSSELLKYLSHGGTMVTYGGMSRKALIVSTGALIFKDVRVVGYWNTAWNKVHDKSVEKNKMFSELCEMIRECQLLPPKAEVFSINDYQMAVSKALEGYHGTKKVLQLQNEHF